MRFNLRTDIERLFNDKNDHSYGKVSKNMVDEQLKNLHLNKVKIKKVEDNQDLTFLTKFENIDKLNAE
jgi:hypothetical protein